MQRRDFIHSLSSMAVLAAMPPFIRNLGARKPNILFIVSDDLGYGDLSITGRRDYYTPAIDQLGREGTVLTQAYSSSAVCTPTRVAMNTGRYPARYLAGLYEPLTMQRIGLPADPPTIAALMKGAGYETALVGKWHLGLIPEFHPLRHGYDEFYGFLGPGADYTSHVDVETRTVSYFQDGDNPARDQGYLTDLFSDRAVSILKRKRDKPFFLNLQYNAPHWPYQAPGDPPYPDSMEMKAGGSPETYAKMMRSMDYGVERILETLQEHKLAENTLVVFTSDNGGEHFANMGPFAKGKLNLWEGGIRVAALARWPDFIKPGSTCNQPCATFDWPATFATIAEMKPDPRAPFDGIDILPQLKGRAPRKRDLYWRMSQRKHQKALRSGDWKYLQTEDGEYLFNIAADPGEKKDRKAEKPEVFAELKAKVAKWESEMLAPVPLNPAEG